MKNFKILVVEDEVLIRLLIVKYLKNFECDIILETSSGETAIEIALSEKPDLILMDIKLQGDINGIEATKKISETNKIPIILMSAFDYKDEIKKIKLSNIIDFLEKPVSKEKLGIIIKNFM